jgi:hypothetical protein
MSFAVVGSSCQQERTWIQHSTAGCLPACCVPFMSMSTAAGGQALTSMQCLNVAVLLILASLVTCYLSFDPGQQLQLVLLC